jgi:eukaryotic-like serine/threonine-protein kinase
LDVRPDSAQTSTLEPGMMVGDYRVTHKLGEGGMGVVYAAVEPFIGKRVAIKVLNAQASAREDLIRRFKEEARAVNKIGHENIIDIFALSQLPDGRHYFIMELLDGESLTQRLRRGPMDFSELRRLLGQICGALEAAHHAGVIHRDLKPDNIWVATRPRSASSIKLLDFGIAKLADIASSAATQSGVPMGTPLYMPPEQAMGRPIDHRADLYALGVVLYQIFAGTLPFLGATHHEIVLKHATETPLPPSRHRPILPEGMEEIILACLEKDPSRRPVSAADLGERIDAAFAGQANVGAAPSTGTLIMPPTATEGPAPGPSATLQLPSAAVVVPSGVGGTSLSSFAGDSIADRPRLRAGRWTAAALVFAGGVTATVLLVSRRTNEGSAARREVPAAIERPIAASPTSVPTAVGELNVPSPSDGGPALAPALAAPAPKTEGGRHHTRSRESNRRDCDPDYYFDSDGEKHFKKECVAR